MISQKVWILVDGKENDQFLLRIEPKNQNIKRNKGDLMWLRNYLQVEFPFYVLPPVDSKSNRVEFI